MISLREDHGGAPFHPRQPQNTNATPSDASPLASRIFAHDGFLRHPLSLEHRPQQEAMAIASANAFSTDQPLLFEAGTGVGKSLAYLLPGIIHAVDTQRQLLVSTATIALQEQIRSKDLELCRNLFNAVPQLNKYADFRTAMLVGRGNYLCTTRLARAIATRAELFPSTQQNELERIALWSSETSTGLVEELEPRPSPEVWEWVNADSSTCSRKNCAHGDCFYWQAQALREKAHVIIVNHSLLFALLGAGVTPGPNTPGILYPHDFAVLDEAHRVPDIATEHFGERISSYGVDRALKTLYNPKTKKGFLSRVGSRHDATLVTQALSASETFFNDLRQRFLRKNDTVRLHEPEWADPLYQKPFAALSDRLGKLLYEHDDETLRQEMRDQRRRILSYLQGLNQCININEEDHVYWLERGGRQGRIVSVRSAPLDVSAYLREALFQRNTSAVLTSATLVTGESMDPFARSVGADDQPRSVVHSPFDYDRNCHIYIATDAPQPSRKQGRLDIDYLADMLTFCALRVDGGTLALFTSYHDLHAVHDRCAHALQAQGRNVLRQGSEVSRHALLRRFRDDGNAVLLGTESFWTGVDVPGPALSQVIITRLPFENPSHPVAEAKSEWMEKQGRNPFMEMTLPDAVLKLRQGMGRLIRSHHDHGIITILDSRILTRHYGKAFLAVLPTNNWQRFNLETRSTSFPNPSSP